MNVIKKIMIGMLSALFILAGCNTGGGQQSTRQFTDDLQRVVEIPQKINKYLPSGSVAQTILFSVAPDKMIGVSAKFTEEQKKYLDPKYHDLQAYGQFYGRNVSMNKEEIIAASPDVIIDLGQVKKNMEEDLDKLQEDLGIPVIFIEAELNTMPAAYEKIGKILNMEKEAQVFVDYCKETLAFAADIKASMQVSKKVYYGEAENGLTTNPIGSMHAEVLEVVGVQNVVPETFANGKSSGESNLEQVIAWNPEVLIFGPDVNVNKIMNDTLWQEITAVKQGQVYQVPNAMQHWFGRPPGVNRYIGIWWLSSIVANNPDKADMVEKTQAFYQLFYHYEMSAEEAQTLLTEAIQV